MASAWVEAQRQAGKIHVDQPGEIKWFRGYDPSRILGPCPHAACRHHAQSVIAWGPDGRRYELVVCDVDEHCAGHCRAWTDGGPVATSQWLQVEEGERV